MEGKAAVGRKGCGREGKAAVTINDDINSNSNSITAISSLLCFDSG